MNQEKNDFEKKYVLEILVQHTIRKYYKKFIEMDIKKIYQFLE